MEQSHVSTGGYTNLIVYTIATSIYDLTVLFCKQYIDKRSRTYDQMVQAARSGKQNIVEGSLEKSMESNIKLTSVARASFGELLEDYRDFLRQNNLPLWDKNDFRVLNIRKIRDFSHNAYMVTLCFKEGYLLDRLLKAQQEKFVREGGFRESLYKKRAFFKYNH